MMFVTVSWPPLLLQYHYSSSLSPPLILASSRKHGRIQVLSLGNECLITKTVVTDFLVPEAQLKSTNYTGPETLAVTVV